MFLRLAEHYRVLVKDLVLSLQALADGLRQRGQAATCYVCGDDHLAHGASFVADLGDGHSVRFLVSDFGISWVECRNGRELVKFEGAEAIQELQRLATLLQSGETLGKTNAAASEQGRSPAPEPLSLAQTSSRPDLPQAA